MPLFTRILIPTDFDSCADKAVALATEMARTFDASLVLMHAFDPAQNALGGASTQGAIALVDLSEGRVRRALEAGLQAARDLWPRTEAILRIGVPSEEILKAATEVHADLIVMATHGRLGVVRALLGSVTEKVVRTATVPVLTLHAK